MKTLSTIFFFIISVNCFPQFATKSYVDSSINAFKKTLDSSIQKYYSFNRDTTVYSDTFSCQKNSQRIYEVGVIYHDTTLSRRGSELTYIILDRDTSGAYSMRQSFLFNTDAVIKQLFQIVKVNGKFIIQLTSRFGHVTQFQYYIKTTLYF